MAPSSGNYVEKIPKQRGRCTSCLCMSWKVFTCIVSHVLLITMVVAYCLLGAYLFERLEADNERQVRNCLKKSVPQPELRNKSQRITKNSLYFNQQMKSEVKYIRGNLSLQLWTYTQEEIYLREENWTMHASKKLLDFENNILEKMKTSGWDGVENPEHLQWTRMGALFYSIIVITTIGNLLLLLLSM